MQNLPAPNPEVYRRAAQMVADREFSYSCLAIRAACQQLGLCSYAESLYVAQYAAMFAPHRKPEVVFESAVYEYITTLDQFRRECLLRGVDASKAFWNQGANKENREARLNALLLMATIVESGG